MNRCFNLLALFFLILICSSCNKKGNSSPGDEPYLINKDSAAVLNISSKIVDFGKVNTFRQEIVELNVLIAYAGAKTLGLYKEDVSCGCMKVEFDKKVLRAGESSKIRILVHTEGNDGFFNKAVFIQSNAKNNPEIIRVKGEFYKD